MKMVTLKDNGSWNSEKEHFQLEVLLVSLHVDQPPIREKRHERDIIKHKRKITALLTFLWLKSVENYQNIYRLNLSM